MSSQNETRKPAHPDDDVWVEGGPFNCSGKLECREITPEHPDWEEFEFERYNRKGVKLGSVLLVGADGQRDVYFVQTAWISDLTTSQPDSVAQPSKA